MTNLVRKINKKVICDTYTCRNMAMFEIGHSVAKFSNMQVCSECLSAIINEGAKFFADNVISSGEDVDTPETKISDATDSVQQATGEMKVVEDGQIMVVISDTAEGKSAENKKNKKNLQGDYENGTNSEPIMQEKSTKNTKIYICKSCNKNFKDLKEYRSHVLTCARSMKAKRGE